MAKSSSLQPIIDFLKSHWPSKPGTIIESLAMNKALIHRYLKELVATGVLTKIGTPPLVVYSLNMSNLIAWTAIRDEKIVSYLDEQYLSYSADGQILQWASGFVSRCQSRNLDPNIQANQWLAYYKSIEKLRDKHWLLDGYGKFQKTLGRLYLKHIKYCDTYQMGQFGKSKLWNLTFYAKQSQNKELIRQVVALVSDRILSYIKQQDYQAVCFAPPSIKREVQFMKELEKWLSIPLPHIKLSKVYPNNIIISQKSIKGTEQRVLNATNTIFLIEKHSAYQKVLIIDDFVGSGATLNESARKLLVWGAANSVDALALLGNIEMWYEVINEV